MATSKGFNSRRRGSGVMAFRLSAVQSLFGSDYGDVVERFCRSIRIQENGCWLWIGGRRDGRYGTFWFRGKPIRTHRMSLKLVGRDCRGQKVGCHSCDTPACVHPDHLWLGSQLENVRDMIRKGRGRNGFTIVGE